jgi:hypothetical protein
MIENLLEVEASIGVGGPEGDRDDRQPVTQVDRPKSGLWPVVDAAHERRICEDTIRPFIHRHGLAASEQVDLNEVRSTVE